MFCLIQIHIFGMRGEVVSFLIALLLNYLITSLVIFFLNTQVVILLWFWFFCSIADKYFPFMNKIVSSVSGFHS